MKKESYIIAKKLINALTKPKHFNLQSKIRQKYKLECILLKSRKLFNHEGLIRKIEYLDKQITEHYKEVNY